MASFLWTPDENPTASNEPRVLTSQMGDGYQQRLRFGLNSSPATLQLEFTNRTPGEIEEIDRFLYDHGGAVGFDYAPQWRPRRNLLLQSENLSHTSTWIPFNASVSGNIIVAPNGQTTGDRLVENTANNQHYISQLRTGSSETMTLSFYAQSASRTRMEAGFTNALNSGANAQINLATKAITGYNTYGADYSAVSAAWLGQYNGWDRYRVTATKASVNSTNGVTFLLADGTGAISYTGNGSSGVNLWGAMVNTGTSALEYEYVGATWSPPIVGCYICPRWQVSPRNCALHTLSATFVQVFDQ